MAVSFVVSKTHSMGWDRVFTLTNVTLDGLVVPEICEYACTIKAFAEGKETILGRKNWILQVTGRENKVLEVWHRDSWLVWQCKGVVSGEILEELRGKLVKVGQRSKL